jgi:hypothetical protein
VKLTDLVNFEDAEVGAKVDETFDNLRESVPERIH